MPVTSPGSYAAHGVASTSTGRPRNAWSGRALWSYTARNIAICSSVTVIGRRNTIHRTPSEQGGVVSEPA